MLKEGSLLARVVVEDAEEHVGGQEDEVAAADQQDGPGHLHVSGVQLLQAVLRSGKMPLRLPRFDTVTVDQKKGVLI